MQTEQAGQDRGRKLPGQVGERGGAAGAQVNAVLVELAGHGERGDGPDFGPAGEQPSGPIRYRRPGGGVCDLLADQAGDTWWQQDWVLAEPQVAASTDGQDVRGVQVPLTCANAVAPDASMLHRIE